MARQRQRVEVLSNGVSEQPPTSRLPNQVKDATNASFSVIDGCTRRAGSWVQQHLEDDLLPAGNNRMHAIVRDQTERYLMVHNRTGSGSDIFVLDLDTNTWATVTIASAAQTYLNSANPDQFRVRTIVDTTIIVNTDKAMAAIELEGTITGISIADPTVITDVAHGLVTGDTVIIAGSNSTPSIDGTHVVTKLTDDTFSIDVAVTGAGSAGTWTSGQIDATTMPVQMVRENTAQDGAITSNSAASPTVVTAPAHGLVTGQVVTITGQTGTVSINGTHTVTVTGTNTFTIAVDCTAGGGTGGSFDAPAYFTIDLITWDQRRSGSSSTNPVPAPWTQGRKISDLRYWRSRLWLFTDEWIVAFQAGDLFNIWIEDVSALAESDRIAVQLSSDEVTVIDYAVPIRDSVLLFTRAGKQFEMAAPDAVTAATLKCKPLTSYRTLDCEPVLMDPAVYFASENACHVQLLEYLYDEIALPSEAEDVSAHAPKFIPLEVELPAVYGDFEAARSTLRRMAVSDEQGSVFLLRRDKVNNGEVFGTKVFVYRSYHLKGEKVQSAWTRWEWAGPTVANPSRGVRGIHDIAVIGTDLYLLVHCGVDSPPDFFILKQAIGSEGDCDTAPTGVVEQT